MPLVHPASLPYCSRRLLPLLRFYTSKSPDKMISLADYAARMKDGQKHIYYLVGECNDCLSVTKGGWAVGAAGRLQTAPCWIAAGARFVPRGDAGTASSHAQSLPHFPSPALPLPTSSLLRPPPPAGSSKDEVAKSPFVEALVEKGYEVLYMVDPLDEYVMQVGTIHTLDRGACQRA